MDKQYLEKSYRLVRSSANQDDTNMILWSAYAHKLGIINYTHEEFIRIYDVYAKGDGTFRHTHRDADWERFCSHDNLKGLIYFAYKYGLSRTFAQRVRVDIYEHPRDWALLTLLKSKVSFKAAIWKPLAYLVYGLVVVKTCARDYKNTKNGHRDVDGKLLYCLLRDIVSVGIFDKLCTFFLKRNFGQDYEATLFHQLFVNDENHPIRVHLYSKGRKGE